MTEKNKFQLSNFPINTTQHSQNYYTTQLQPQHTTTLKYLLLSFQAALINTHNNHNNAND